MRGGRRSALASLLAALALGGTAGRSAEPGVEGETPVWFEEVAASRGIDFRHQSGHRPGRYLFPEIHAGGAALFDADGDGDLDAYLVQAGGLERPTAQRPPNRLYLNLGGGRFRDATEGSGADDRGYGMGVTAGDYDGDGLVDLYVTNVGPNVLLRNLGDGRFADVTRTAGVAGDAWSSSAAFLDFDRDGDLDLFVASYLHWSIGKEVKCLSPTGQVDYCGPAKYHSPAPDVLYRNEGGGRFTDVTREAELQVAFGTGLGVTSGDFDGNGWPDLFVANDNMLDQLWLNQGDGTFRDEAVFWGAAADSSGKPKAGMGVTRADVDGDGDLDLLVCNLAGETDSLFLNQGRYFRDQTDASGLAARSRAMTRFGMAWADFDNDGLLDLYQANGAIARQGLIHDPEDPYAEPNLLFRGQPGPSYREVLPRGGTRPPGIATSRGAAFGDVDGDGSVDVLVVNRDAPAHLLLNRVGRRGHWLRVEVQNAAGAPALGATVTAEIGSERRRRDVVVAYSYQSANDPAVHLGLGEIGRVDRLEVLWPDGARECFTGSEADRTLTLVRGAGGACPEAAPETG